MAATRHRAAPPGMPNGSDRAPRCPPLATQRDFLGAMGIEPRVRALLERADTTDEARHALAAGAMRLTDADGMGGAYKAFALASADVGAVPGAERGDVGAVPGAERGDVGALPRSLSSSPSARSPSSTFSRKPFPLKAGAKV